MLDMKFLASRGVSSAAWKRIFSDSPENWPPKIKRLINQVTARIRDGRVGNLDPKEWRAIGAIDRAYSVPYNQSTPTLIRDILDRNLDHDGTVEALKAWGLNEEELFMTVRNPETGRDCQVPNPPVFFRVIPNLVKAYTTAVCEKLFNARNQRPLLEFKPRKQVERDVVECDIVTDLVDDMAMKMGYAPVLRAAIDQMLKYGVCIAFTKEEWYCEYQREFGGALDKEGKDKGKKRTVKEGLRYFIPHPTRMYYDLKCPLTSLNTNTGCEYIGHWHVLSYGQILDNPQYWNRKHIFAGTNWFEAPESKYFWQEIYPCKMNFLPGIGYDGPRQREDKSAFYNSADRDKSIFVAEHFERLIPQDWGLGEYDGPVWCRFTMAADNTPIWVEPCAVTPGFFMGYDYSENAERNPSFSLEVMPWQDWIGNILSQILLTAKQNLVNVLFVDNQQVDATIIKEFKNLGEGMFRGIQIIPFDSLSNRAGQLDTRQAFMGVNLPKANIQELFQILSPFLNMMERVLRIAAQQAGGAGPHQQGKKEIEMLAASGDERLNYIGAGVDEGLDAWAIQLVDAAVNYADAEFLAQVDVDTENLEELAEEMGFTVESKGKDKALIKGSWRKLQLRDFARTIEGKEQSNDKEAGQAILSCVTAISGQEDLKKKIGPVNLLTMMELATRLMGAPRGWRLRASQEKDDGGVEPKVLEAIQAGIKACMQAIEEKLGKPLGQEMAQVQGEVKQIQEALKQFQGVFQKVSQLADAQTIKAQETQSKIQTRTAEVQAEQQRKDAAAAADKARKDAEAQADIARKDQEAQAAIRRDEEKLKADIAVQTHEAARGTAIALHEAKEKAKNSPSSS